MIGFMEKSLLCADNKKGQLNKIMSCSLFLRNLATYRFLCYFYKGKKYFFYAMQYN